METEGGSDSMDLRVASFSCYLKPHESEFNVFGVDKLTGFEKSSWNNNPRNIVSLGKRFFHGLRPCLTKKTACVDQSYETNGDRFEFPVLKTQFYEEPRKSLKVFGPGVMTKAEILKSLERKMSILTWDAIPKAINDDVASDASSDLFEIDNISRTGSFRSCGMSPSTQYAASEASVEWSVVTESAAEFSSDEKKPVSKVSGGRKKDRKIRPAGGLLGCTSHKSVEVAEIVCRTSGKSKH